MAITLIIGLGESGLAMARWLTHQHVALRIADTRQSPPKREMLAQLGGSIEFVGGELALSLLDGVDQIVLSPGLSPYVDPLKTLIDAALARQISVIGELDLFCCALGQLAKSNDYQPRILAITGTNGKTTTTMLTHHLVEASGLAATVAGNVSPSLLDALYNHLLTNTLPNVWVLELSSFQLDVVKTWRCDAAVVLNLTEDHLDWHIDMTAYASAKANIFKGATAAIVNRDDVLVAGLPQALSSMVSFGQTAPSSAGDFGLVDQDGLRWLAQAVVVGQEKTGRGKYADVIDLKLLMPVDGLLIKGLHNATNALAALALCQAIDLPLAPLLHALRTYRGEPHRMAFVATIRGIDFVDDSKGTNVGATVAALQGSSQPIVLIAGGDGKGQSFEPLLLAAKNKVRAVCLIGKDAQALKRVFDADHIPTLMCVDLAQATQRAFECAVAGDMVLLSPACASLDMFKDYKHRAAVFVDAVQNIALDAGQPC